MTTITPTAPLGIIAGSGELPRQILRACAHMGRAAFTIGFENITEDETLRHGPHAKVHLGKVGAAIKKLKAQGVAEVLLAGRVGRPTLSALKMDFTGMKLLHALSKLDSHGDDKVFSTIIGFLEKQGFAVVGAEDVLQSLLIPKGTLGAVSPDAIAARDIDMGMKAALAIGSLDIGQAVIVQQGTILGVEAAEGTDQLIARCKAYQAEGVGGVLVKMKKPQQDARVDLPSIGTHTIENAYMNGLRGIAVQAGATLVINRDAVIQRADELGLFVVGV